MILGFDIGGTKCAVMTAEVQGENIEFLKKEKCATRFDISPEEMIESLIKSAENILDGEKPEKKAKMLRLNPTLSEEVLSKLQLAVPAIPLPSLTGLNSAFCNDVDPQLVYAQELMGLGKTGDMLLCISTSGNSANCVAAAEVGKALGLTVIALTGSKGGLLKEKADVCICVPETETFKVQELHLPVYHYLCAKAEKVLFD